MQDNFEQQLPPEIPQTNSHKPLLFGILLVGIVLVVLAVVGVITLRRSPNTSSTAPVQNAAGQPLVAAQKDSDADGISDDEEVRLGTRPDVYDTDGDGLGDGYEVNVTKTDPKNAHSKDQSLTDLQWVIRNQSKR